MDYENATVKEITDHFATVSRQRQQQILKRYQERGNDALVAKIQQAKKLLKLRKYQTKSGYTPAVVRATRSLWCSISQRLGKGAYKGCTMEWTSVSELRVWLVKQIGFGKENFELDKDVLVKGNRVYGPNTCVFLPIEINSLFSGCYKAQRRGQYPLGVSYNRTSGSFVAQMSNRQERGLDKYLGSFKTVAEAFACYKAAKEAKIKYMANKWKDQIDPRAYEALMARTVEWDD